MNTNTTTERRSGPRRSLARRHRFFSPRGMGGQIIVFYLVFIIPMAMLMFSIYNVGQLATEKMKLQTAADNAAYSAAVWEARYMNLDAYINRAMVANYDTMAMLLSIWSVADSWDGFIGILKFVTQFIPFGIGAAIKGVLTPVHIGLHKANFGLAKALGGGKEGKALLFVMETYIKILSFAQEALYFANQAGRIGVIQSIAWGVDKKIQYLGLAEILNAVSLNSRVKWDKLNSANKFTEDKALRQTITRSLNELSRGENFRDAGSSLLAPINDVVFAPFNALCKLITLGSGEFSISIGPKGFDNKDFDEITGKIGGPGECKDECDADKIVQNDKLYQHDFAGVDLQLCVVGVRVGHHSDDAYNTGGSKTVSGSTLNVAPPHLVDDVETSGDDHGAFQDVKNFTNNGIQCSSVGADLGSAISGGSIADNCVSSSNDTCNFQNPLTGPLLTQKVQDGSVSPAEYQAACQQSLCSNVPEGKTCQDQVPDLQQRLDAANRCGSLLAPGGQQSQGGTNFAGQSAGVAGAGPCQTVYMFDTPLNEMKMTWFERDIDVALDGRRMQGPTIFVYFEKAKENLPLFLGLHYPNPQTLGVYSFAKVYYTRRPSAGAPPVSPGSGSTRIEGKETLFNPFWAARLERPKIGSSIPLLH
jgi:putative Flp pilus-assembly TadE/G-like protein